MRVTSGRLHGTHSVAVISILYGSFNVQQFRDSLEFIAAGLGEMETLERSHSSGDVQMRAEPPDTLNRNLYVASTDRIQKRKRTCAKKSDCGW